jgi:outer membrane protein assembly factor BamB
MIYAIDAQTGNVYWKKELEDDPAVILPQYSILDYSDGAAKKLYYADKENIYALSLGKDGGKVVWTFNFDKNKVGEYDPEESYAINETLLGNKRTTSSTTVDIGGGYSMTTTTTSGGVSQQTAVKFIQESDDADMTTTYSSWGRIWGVSARKCLKVLYGGPLFLVIGEDGIALVDAASGTAKWTKEWDYDKDDITYLPKIIGDKLLYCLDEKLVLVNLQDGKEIWNSEEPKGAKLFLSPTEEFLFSIEAAKVAGYSIKNSSK